MSWTKKQMAGKDFKVYILMLKGSEKKYVGMTCGFENRVRTHLSMMMDPKVMTDPETIYGEFKARKLDRKDVTVYIVEENLTFAEADRLETEMIEKYKTWHPDFGWNKAKKFDCLKGVNVVRGLPDAK